MFPHLPTNIPHDFISEFLTPLVSSQPSSLATSTCFHMASWTSHTDLTSFYLSVHTFSVFFSVILPHFYNLLTLENLRTQVLDIFSSEFVLIVLAISHSLINSSIMYTLTTTKLTCHMQAYSLNSGFI